MDRHVIHFLLLCLLAGCASLPDVAYLRDRQSPPSPAPTIVGAHGALPPVRQQALLGALKARVGPTDILTRHIAAEEAINGSPLVAGNKVTLLDDGPATMRAMMAAIREARDHVNLETYIFEDDEVGRALAALLIEKCKAGVVVHLIYDSVGTLDTSSIFFDRLRAAGVHALEYNPVNPLTAHGNWNINQRDHRKLLVVDGRVAFTGGVNISRVYGRSSFLGSRHRKAAAGGAQEPAWRDTHMRIEGPAVARFQALFLDTWRRQTDDTLADARYFPPLKKQGTALVRAIGSTPEQAEYTIYKTYVSAFTNADRYAHLTIAYFVPDRAVLQSMTDAARRRCPDHLSQFQRRRTGVVRRPLVLRPVAGGRRACV